MDYNVEAMRAEILEQLRKRELYVPNADSLPMEQLLNVYNRFIVPYPRRERRDRRRTPAEVSTKGSKETPMQLVMLTNHITVVSMVSDKRPRELTEDQHLFSSTRKRIKIDTLQ